MNLFLYAIKITIFPFNLTRYLSNKMWTRFRTVNKLYIYIYNWSLLFETPYITINDFFSLSKHGKSPSLCRIQDSSFRPELSRASTYLFLTVKRTTAIRVSGSAENFQFMISESNKIALVNEYVRLRSAVPGNDAFTSCQGF